MPCEIILPPYVGSYSQNIVIYPNTVSILKLIENVLLMTTNNPVLKRLDYHFKASF